MHHKNSFFKKQADFLDIFEKFVIFIAN